MLNLGEDRIQTAKHSQYYGNMLDHPTTLTLNHTENFWYMKTIKTDNLKSWHFKKWHQRQTAAEGVCQVLNLRP
jgi:hypothetical protein